MTQDQQISGDEASESTASTEASEATGLTVVSLDDFEAVDLEAPLAGAESVCCAKLAGAYQVARDAAKTEGKEREARVYGLLSDVMHMNFKPEDRAEPYGPLFVMDGRRGIIPSDLRGEHSKVFATIAPTIENPGLRALLSDVAWLNDRSLLASAQLAISSFCEAVALVAAGRAKLYLDDQTETSDMAAEILRRGCQIATATGWKEPESGELKALIAAITERAAASSDADGYLNFGTLSADFGVSEPSQIAVTAEALAQNDGLHPDAARLLWELAARAHRYNNNDGENGRCMVMAAECYVDMAATAGFKGMVAASWLMDAIRALRRIPGTRTRRDELEAKLRGAQASISDEMMPISTELDLTEIVDHARKSVRGLTLAQALAEFAQLDTSPNPDDLQKQALELFEQHPLSSGMPMAMHDDEGKLIAQSPGLLGDEDGRDDALRHLILRNESLRRGITVSGMIEPARRLINAEHPMHMGHFRQLVCMSPFVPAGHEELFALGFARFFGGDFVSALHILVPQLENSLRHVLKLASVEPSSIKNDMTQTNRTLSVMLDKDRATLDDIFGPAIVFEIENVFDLSGGPALRHEIAHGLLSEAGCSGRDAIYACWFIFRLCALPLFAHWDRVAEAYVRM